MMDAYIGVGSNISPKENIYRALITLSENVTITGISTFYWTDAVAEYPQEKYLNGVWRIRTSYSPAELKFGILHVIEKKLKRQRTKDRNAPRTIDLDLILYGNHVIRSDYLIIPDPDIYHRPFVAIPLYELDSALVLPDTNTPISNISKLLMDESLMPDMSFTKSIKRILVT